MRKGIQYQLKKLDYSIIFRAKHHLNQKIKKSKPIVFLFENLENL